MLAANPQFRNGYEFSIASFPSCCGYTIINLINLPKDEVPSWNNLVAAINTIYNSTYGALGRAIIVCNKKLFESLGGAEALPKYSDVAITDNTIDLIMINVKLITETLPQR